MRVPTLWRWLLLSCLLLETAVGFNYLILHPFYSGSHVLTLHAVSERLIEMHVCTLQILYVHAYV